MVDEELLIGQLRNQVRHLQSLVNDLESRYQFGQDEYAYVRTRLRELIQRLHELERFSSERGAVHRLRAEWMN